MSFTCQRIVYVTGVPDICLRQILGMVTCESYLLWDCLCYKCTWYLSATNIRYGYMWVFTCHSIVCVAGVPDLVTGVYFLLWDCLCCKCTWFGYRCVLHVIGLSVLLVYLIWVCLTCNGIVCVAGRVSAIGAPNLPIARGAIVLEKNSIIYYQ